MLLLALLEKECHAQTPLSKAPRDTFALGLFEVLRFLLSTRGGLVFAHIRPFSVLSNEIKIRLAVFDVCKHLYVHELLFSCGGLLCFRSSVIRVLHFPGHVFASHVPCTQHLAKIV